jgi:hypothetical protein
MVTTLVLLVLLDMLVMGKHVMKLTSAKAMVVIPLPPALILRAVSNVDLVLKDTKVLAKLAVENPEQLVLLGNPLQLLELPVVLPLLPPLPRLLPLEEEVALEAQIPNPPPLLHLPAIKLSKTVVRVSWNFLDF